MKYYLIAGEASGDLHGSNLMKGLKEVDNQAEFRFWGGDLMNDVGNNLAMHYKNIAFMGLLPVILNFKTILRNLAFCKQDILEFAPDIVIFIDYPGFNLQIAKFAKENNLKTFYYISPKIWAWKESRIKKIKKYVDKMYVIFPFEIDFYKKHEYKVEFAGNPLVDSIDNRADNNESFHDFISKNNLLDKPIIGLLAGSRKQEIENILPEMLNMVEIFPKYQFIIGAAPSIDSEFYYKIIGDRNVKILYDQTYQLLQQSDAALVTSGTATLETAILNIPQVVCYKFKGGGLIYTLSKIFFLKVPYISLVNLIMDKLVVKELIQQYLNKKSLKEELEEILTNKEYKETMISNYDTLRSKLGKPGASKRFAQLIYNELNNN